MHACVHACVWVNYINYSFVSYVTFAFSITVLWVLKYTICIIAYCDVVNVQPHFNFSNEIIKLSWISNLSCITALSCVFDACVHQILLVDYNTTKAVPYIWESLVCGSFSFEPNFWWCVLYPQKPTFNFHNSWTNFFYYIEQFLRKVLI